jgi:hypothetical protein
MKRTGQDFFVKKPRRAEWLPGKEIVSQSHAEFTTVEHSRESELGWSKWRIRADLYLGGSLLVVRGWGPQSFKSTALTPPKLQLENLVPITLYNIILL